MKYLYRCDCGPFETDTRGDKARCLKCGGTAKRVWAVNFDRESTKQSGRWDPQVGCYVANDREFQEKLREGAAHEEAEVGMECKLMTVDARDDQALGELHGTGVDHRLAERENTQRALHDEKAKANKEHKPKVLTS